MRIRRAAGDAIAAHARAEAPFECCGLLIGSKGLIEEAYPAANLLGSETRYQVDPADHFAAIHRARSSGREVVGAYHSHPRSPAVPSPTDIAEANDPGFVHVIVSLMTPAPDLRCYRIADGKAAEVALVNLKSTIHNPEP